MDGLVHLLATSIEASFFALHGILDVGHNLGICELAVQAPTFYSTRKSGELVIAELTCNEVFLIKIKREAENRAWGLGNLSAARQTYHCHGMRPSHGVD